MTTGDPLFTYEQQQPIEADEDTRPARFYMRVLAYFLDGIFIGLAWILVDALLALDKYVWELVVVLYYLTVFGYFVVLEGWTGQTLGKWLSRIRVAMVDGSQVTVTAAALRRFVFMAVGFLPLLLAVVTAPEMASIGCLLVLALLIGSVFTSPIRQGFHDRLASTKVVEVGAVVPWKETLWRQAGDMG